MKKHLLATIFTMLLPLCAGAQDINSMSLDYTNPVEYSPSGTTFLLFAPENKQHAPILRLYNEGVGGKPFKTIRMKPVENYGWKAEVKGNLKDKFYTFDVWGTKREHKETPGIYARAVGVNGVRGAVIDMNETNPVGWNEDHRVPTKSAADLVIYELHHRDFSIDASSGLVHKGKYLALTEKKAINYLKSLGVNAIHILPSFDYASVDEQKPFEPQYNWGYDPLNYNVPEGSYSYDACQPERRIMEFKQMVQTLHKAGIRVILDVVYNHTFNIEGSSFERTFPKGFYRYTADGKPGNGSGCGNETASERTLMHQFMLQSVKYWAQEYHIDGFRFDLMGVHDIATMNDIRAELNAIDPNIFVYGEGWSAGTCAYPTEKLAMKANMQQMKGIAAFCDDMRDALRGPFSDDKKGAFLAGIPGEEESLKAGIAGMIDHPQVDYSKVNYSKKAWASEPTQMISYVSCHDDMCLTDRLRAEMPGISTDELIRLDCLAQTAVFLSQGVPFMLCGEEMLRTKQGVHNSYNSPDSINHLDWDNLKRYPQVFSYYQQLIKLRHDHPAFRLGSAQLVRKHLEFLPVESPCLVVFRLKEHAGNDEWNNIIVILNGNKEAKTVSVPQGNYTVVACDGKIDQAGLDSVQSDKVIVDGQSALILHD